MYTVIKIFFFTNSFINVIIPLVEFALSIEIFFSLCLKRLLFVPQDLRIS